MAEEKIYRVKLEGADRAAKNLGVVEAELKKVNKQRTDLINTLEKEGKLSKKQELDLQKLTKKQAGLRDEKNRYNAILRIEAKNNAALTTTYQKLSHALNENRKKYKELVLQNKQNTKAGKELLKTIGEQDKKLKDVDATVGQHQRSVGNYTGGIKDALSQVGLMPHALTKMATATTAVTAATNTGTKAMKVFKFALASTGIGLLIVAISSLVAYFKRTEEGASKLQQILAPFKVLIGNLGDLFGDLGEGMVSAFEDPQQAIKDLWEFIKGQFINRINATMKFFSAFGDILQGVWELDTDKIKAGAVDAGNAYIDMLTGVEDTTKKVMAGIADIYNETVEESAILVQIEKDRLALAKRTRAFILEEAKLQTEIAKNRLIANDESIDLLTRQTAINEALEGTKYLGDIRIEIQEEQLRLMKAEAELSDTNAETLDAIAAKEVEIVAIRTTQFNNSKMMVSRQGTINRKLEREIELRNELLNLEPEIPEEENVEDEGEYLAGKFQESLDGQLTMLQARYDLGLISTAQYNDEMAKLEAERAKTAVDIEAFATKQKLQAASMSLQAMSGLFKEGSIAQRMMASGAAMINTYLAITGALAPPPIGLGPVAGIPLAIATGIMGLAQVAKINAVKFAEGGIIGGQPHSQGGTTFTGSDGSSFEAERGEFLAIVNKRDAETAEAYSQINSNHGRSYFADGGTFTPEAAAQDNNLAAMNAMRAELADLRVYVVESDISEMQNHVEIVENEGDF